MPEEHEVQFIINVASYYPTVPTPEETDTNTTNTTNTVTQTPEKKNVTLKVYVGGVEVQNTSVSKTTTDHRYAYTASESKEVLITIDGNQIFRNMVNFSQPNQVITVSK